MVRSGTLAVLFPLGHTLLNHSLHTLLTPPRPGPLPLLTPWQPARAAQLRGSAGAQRDHHGQVRA